MKRAAWAAVLLAACNTLPPDLKPPPFGPVRHGDTKLFFPTGLAATSDGALLVANGNFNHAYDGGSVVGLRPDFIKAIFTAGLSCDAFPTPAGCDQSIPADAPAVIIGNYAGPLVLND